MKGSISHIDDPKCATVSVWVLWMPVKETLA